MEDACFRMRITLGVIFIRSLVRAICVPVIDNARNFCMILYATKDFPKDFHASISSVALTFLEFL